MPLQNILVVDDDKSHCRLMKEVLEEDGRLIVSSAANAEECLSKLANNNIDIVILDYSLPKENGLEVTEKIKNEGYELPIIMVTGRGNEEIAVQAIKLGVCDYLVKSPDLGWLIMLPMVVKRCLENQQVLQRKRELEKKLQEDFINTISTLAALIEIKDPYTGGHSRAVRDLSLAVANRLKLAPKKLEEIEIAAFLHDIGKIGIPGKVLNKSEGLTPKEYAHIQKHAELGSVALKHVRRMGEVSDIIKHHHESYNGSGYPDGLKGEEIPLGSRIIHIADAYSAMSSNRPYRSAMPRTEVIAELEKGKGTEFDPQLLNVFFQILWEHLEIISQEKTVLQACLKPTQTKDSVECVLRSPHSLPFNILSTIV